MRTVPLSGSSSPASRNSSVLLPDPLGPITATTSPRSTASDTSTRLITAPCVRVSPLASTCIVNLPVAHREPAVGALRDPRIVGHGEYRGALARSQRVHELEQLVGGGVVGPP